MNIAGFLLLTLTLRILVDNGRPLHENRSIIV
jgi:hypothetical protein